MKDLIGTRWLHKKRGTKYIISAQAKMQCSSNLDLDYMNVIVYVSMDSSDCWVRPAAEFFDGRFERITE